MKKFVTALLALLVSMSMLFGCTNTGEPVGSETEKRETETEENLDTETEKQENDSIKALEILPEHIEYAKSDIRYKWIVSFLSRDVEGCAEVLEGIICGVKSDALTGMKPLETIEFSSYSVTPGDNEYELCFDFEISKSGYELYPVGKYSTVIHNGMFEAAISFEAHMREISEDILEEYSDVYDFVYPFISLSHESAFPEGYNDSVRVWDHYTTQLFLKYRDVNELNYSQLKLTKSEIADIASQIYAIDDFEGYPEMLYDIGDGYYTLVGHGGTGSSHTVIDIREDGDKVYVDVQYYSDIMEFIDAGVFTYTLERTDTVYGFRLLKVEETVESPNQVWTFTN